MSDADHDPDQDPQSPRDGAPDPADPATPTPGAPAPGEGVFGPRLGIRSLRAPGPADDPAEEPASWAPTPPPPPSAWSSPAPPAGGAPWDVPGGATPGEPSPWETPGGARPPDPVPWDATGGALPPAGIPPAPEAPPPPPPVPSPSAAPPAGLPPSGVPQPSWQAPALGGWGAPAPTPAAPPGRRSGPHPLLLAGVAALVIVAVAVGAGVLLGSDDPRRGGAAAGSDEPQIEHPDTWDPRVEPLVDWVADERDLEFLHPVEVEFLTEEEYQERATVGAEELDEDAVAEIDDFVAMSRALGLVRGEVDLVGAASDLQASGTLAYYDPALERVTVRGTELTPSVRATLVHELTHVLQDQHFDLSRIGDPDFERAGPLRAIVEGDAGRIEDAYVAEELSAEERAEHQRQSESDGDAADADLADVPSALVASSAAPYVLGEGFVAYQERVEGGDVIDDLLEDPPTEEELLDPAVRATSRAVDRNVTVDAPAGADVLDEGDFGPLTWYFLLASQRDPAQALTIVDGWGGDHYVAYEQDDRVCVSAVVVGDDGPATDRLHVGLATWAAAAPGEASVSVSDGVVELRSCDPGPAAAPVGEVTPELLAVPFLRAELESTLRAQGATAEQARCASSRLLAALTFEELTAPSSAADPARMERVAGEIRACT